MTSPAERSENISPSFWKEGKRKTPPTPTLPTLGRELCTIFTSPLPQGDRGGGGQAILFKVILFQYHFYIYPFKIF